MTGLSDEPVFDPAAQLLRFTIAANDLARDLPFPDLGKRAARCGIDLRSTFMPSGVPGATMVKDARCNLVITPLPPDGPDIPQKKLFEGNMVCFYDASVRQPPTSWEAFCTGKHIEVRFFNGRNSFRVVSGVDGSSVAPPIVSVPDFSAIPHFVKGSDMIAAELNYMSRGPLPELDKAPLPFDCTPVPVFPVWHRRDRTDPAHRWIRREVAEAARSLPLVL